jgi:hypothetical protein
VWDTSASSCGAFKPRTLSESVLGSRLAWSRGPFTRASTPAASHRRTSALCSASRMVRMCALVCAASLSASSCEGLEPSEDGTPIRRPAGLQPYERATVPVFRAHRSLAHPRQQHDVLSARAQPLQKNDRSPRGKNTVNIGFNSLEAVTNLVVDSKTATSFHITWTENSNSSDPNVAYILLPAAVQQPREGCALSHVQRCHPLPGRHRHHR